MTMAAALLVAAVGAAVWLVVGDNRRRQLQPATVRARPRTPRSIP